MTTPVLNTPSGAIGRTALRRPFFYCIAALAALVAPALAAETVTLEPEALAHIRSAQPERTFGAGNLWINGNPAQMRSNLIVFRIPERLRDPEAPALRKAELHLTKAASSGNIHYKWSADLHAITAPGAWDGSNPPASRITWANAPHNDPDQPGPEAKASTKVGSRRLSESEPVFDVTRYLRWASGQDPSLFETEPTGTATFYLSTAHPVVYRYHGANSYDGPKLKLHFGEAAETAEAKSEAADQEAENRRKQTERPAPEIRRGGDKVRDALNALVGDGKADDTEAIQTLFGSGETVRLPKGVYRVTETIEAATGTRITGAGGAWNTAASGGSVLYYDGEPGGTLLDVVGDHFFQLRQVSLHGGGRADIGVYWKYSTQDALMEDVSIRHTNEHALYITKTWYAHFTRLTVRNNNGRGVTLDRERFPELAAGPVNYVTFEQCQLSHSGKANRYSEPDNLDVGYGIGSFGYNNMINVIACAIEKNGGPGVYLGGHAGTMRFEGCYIEYNCETLKRKDQRMNGEDAITNPDRKSVGHQANVLTNTEGRDAIVFDTCYFHPFGGIWMRDDASARNPIVFRRCTSPTAVWTRHDNFVYESDWQPEFPDTAGVISRDGKSWAWSPGQ